MFYVAVIDCVVKRVVLMVGFRFGYARGGIKMMYVLACDYVSGNLRLWE